MKALVELLKRFKDHPKMMELDKAKIESALKEFEVELSKVSGPIVEKYQSVGTRLVQPGVGNPSDGSYSGELEKKTNELQKA